MIKEKRITIKDIANEIGYSFSLVAQVLRNDPKLSVSESTRELILTTAERMGYIPNLYAKILSNGKTGLIGILACIETVEVYQKSLLRLIDLVTSNGYQCSIKIVENTPDALVNQVREMISSSVEGVLITYTNDVPASHITNEFIKAGIPVVSLVYSAGETVDRVLIDFKSGAYEAVTHLLELGHRRIGMLHRLRDFPNTALRTQGYLEALADYGIAEDRSLMVGDDNADLMSEWYPYAKRLIESSKDMTAVFSNNDVSALAIMKAAREFGYRIPEDLAVVGYNDDSYCEFFPTQLSSVKQPIAEQAEAAVELLLGRINKPNKSEGHKTIMLKTEYIMRDSSGKAREVVNEEKLFHSMQPALIT